MKEAFDELYRLALMDRKNSPWSRQQSITDRHTFIMDEAKEIGDAIKNDDMKNLREELGDTIFTVLGLIAVCEEKKLFTGQDIIDDVVVKIKNRKPWILTGEEISVDEEIRRWTHNKNMEKGRNH